MKDFAASEEFGRHEYAVDVGQNYVELLEDQGYSDNSMVIKRARISLKAWRVVKDTVERVFTALMREQGVYTGRRNVRFHSTGQTRMDRSLGQQLCVLFWAIGTGEVTPTMISRWENIGRIERSLLWSLAVPDFDFALTTHPRVPWVDGEPKGFMLALQVALQG